MSLWLDFLGAEIRHVNTRSFGRVRIAEAGKGKGDTLVLMHGIGGHLEAYAKNIVALSDTFHVVAFDFVGHGLSEKRLPTFSPAVLAEQLGELMDELGVARAHLSGESLGGWVAGEFALRQPDRVRRLVLNTAGGIPIVSEKGRQDLQQLIALTARNANQMPTRESVLTRMKWLLHESNWGLLTQELVGTRLHFYSQPDAALAAPAIGRFMSGDTSELLLKLEQLTVDTLFFWTRDNPIHDLEAAKAAVARTPKGRLYVMKADAAHWPQYESPEEFNSVVRQFLCTGSTAASVLGEA